MGSPNREAVKVVLIETKYVETDATTFKSIVQSLTGKDATVINNGGSGKRKRGATRATPSPALDVKTPNDNDNHNHDDIACDDAVSRTDDHSSSLSSMSFLTSGMSFKDLDRMLLEMPPLEELPCWLWDQ
ncbi:uncharacterized protein LOC133801695 [Humulus lupulus]|uniref:uncharacterized protein LOC133801695 n=1 Tax=Humulus lupulus TaxID=3486 RepID=UPI002B40D86D|nr:uncharacterized protein LOC133801695 [Humulus lupulus]